MSCLQVKAGRELVEADNRRKLAAGTLQRHSSCEL